MPNSQNQPNQEPFINPEYQAQNSHHQNSQESNKMPYQNSITSHFSQLITHLSGIVYQSILYPDGTQEIIHISPNCNEILGLEATEILQNKTLLWALIHPEDQTGFWHSFTTASAHLKTWKWEWRNFTPTGKTKWLSGVAIPATQPNGSIIWQGLILDISKHKEATILLRQQLSRERLVTGIQERIRKTLNLQDILQTAVEEVRYFLETDRTVIYQFNPDWSGKGIVESVGEKWMPILGIPIFDPCFKQNYVSAYQQGRIRWIDDIQNSPHLTPCYVKLLTRFQVRANLVVPILQGENLWGLLIAHHCCGPRQWSSSEIECLVQISGQLAIALQQATLVQQLQTELQERQAVETALRSSQYQLQAAQRITHLGSWELNVCTQALTWSEELYHIMGLDPEQPAPPWPQYLQSVHPEDRQSLKDQIIASIQDGIPHDLDFRILRPDGTIRHLNGRGEAIRDSEGKIIKLLGIALDITERKQAELALQASETQFRELAQRKELLNRLAERIRQTLNLDTILATTVKEVRDLLRVDRCHFAWYYPDDTTPLWELVKEAKLDTAPSLLGYYTPEQLGSLSVQLLNQEIVQVDDVATVANVDMQELMKVFGHYSTLLLPIKTESGKIGLIACTYDHEPHAWRPEEIQTLQAVVNQLAIAINQAELYFQSCESAKIATDKSLELELTLQELRQTQASLIQAEKMSSLGQMVAGIAHEINNPVNFIFGNLIHAEEYITDLLELITLYQTVYPHPEPIIENALATLDLEFLATDIPQLLNSMKVGAGRIQDIVKCLRTFSRLDESEMKQVDLHTNLESTLMLLEHRLKAKAERPMIQVIKDYQSLPRVECYIGQLNQVFMNIFTNAIDALDVLAHQQSQTHTTPLNFIPQIKIQTETLPHEAIRIRIIDNGCGMTPETQAKIFDPFYTTKPVGQGTGLGLSVSYQIVVEKHGGQFQCQSTLNQGSEFIIEIPQKQTSKRIH